MNSAMTLEQIMLRAPAAFEDYPASTVNDKKYRMIKTQEVIEPMERLGFNVVDAQQRRTRKDEWQDKTYHFLRFRNEDLRIGDDYLEILISNSHNASSSFKIQLAILRLACSNGLIVGTNLVSPLTLQHQGLSSKLISQMATMYASAMAEHVTSAVTYMKNTPISYEQAKQFAKTASAVKHNEYEVNTNELLIPRRYEDRKEDVWTTYNIVQEHLMLGDYHIKGANDEWRNARKISSPASAVELNAKLFELAMEAA